MRLFLDTSVLMAALASETGASRAVVSGAASHDWQLLVSSYVPHELDANFTLLPLSSAAVWDALRSQLQCVPDVVSFEWVTVFAPAKDRPVPVHCGGLGGRVAHT